MDDIDNLSVSVPLCHSAKLGGKYTFLGDVDLGFYMKKN
jgi:hypothetical protein